MPSLDVKARFDDLGREVAATKTAANEAKTAANNLGAAVTAIPASIAGSTPVKEAMKEAVERSNIGSGVSEAKAAAEGAKTAAEDAKKAAEDAKKAAEDVVGRDELKDFVQEAVKDELEPIKDELKGLVEVLTRKVQAASVLTNPQGDLLAKIEELRQIMEDLQRRLSSNSIATVTLGLADEDTKKQARAITQNEGAMNLVRSFISALDGK